MVDGGSIGTRGFLVPLGVRRVVGISGRRVVLGVVHDVAGGTVGSVHGSGWRRVAPGGGDVAVARGGHHRGHGRRRRGGRRGGYGEVSVADARHGVPRRGH